ncbi:NUDIX hydrolase YfcD [Endozoicomonas sp. ALD040]|uniref:NUDIX hydrolase YfcD n=1 Tax=unclassified Endozoicomonas TaxID=2644528 RepID=UPI003BAE35C7
MPSNPELQPASEKVIIVDESNQVLGALPRSQMREKKLCHRATYVFVFNSKGQLYVQERTLSKDIYPGYFEPATGGVVAEGESYDVAAVRELAEELGIEDTPLEPLFHFYFQNDDCKVWGRVYSCQYEGELRLQEEEVARVIMESPEEIRSNRFNRTYTPDSLVALERLMNLYGDREISA